jgi:AraC-like DNA-binding protein
MRELDPGMINIHDFICSHANEFRQVQFDRGSKVFIEYDCPLKQNSVRVWSHKNCLLYVLSGSKTYAALSSSQVSGEGRLLFVRKGGLILHQQFEKPYRALIFMFDDEAVKQFFLDHPELAVRSGEQTARSGEVCTVAALGPPGAMAPIFRSCLEYAQRSGPSTGVALGLKFQELLLNLLESRDAGHFRGYLFEVCMNRDLSFMQLMRENAHYHFTCGELARIAGMSMSAFKRKFRGAFGSSPGKWLREQRMQRARAWLGDPGRTISEIAFELGYNDVAAFSKAFRTHTGTGPSDHRSARNH